MDKNVRNTEKVDTGRHSAPAMSLAQGNFALEEHTKFQAEMHAGTLILTHISDTL